METGEAHYYSRSRNTLWHKGGTSGHVQRIKSIRLDCDADTLIYLVEQVGGAACHKGYRSCFYRDSKTAQCRCVAPVFDPKEVINKCQMARFLNSAFQKAPFRTPRSIFSRAPAGKSVSITEIIFPKSMIPNTVLHVPRAGNVALCEDGTLDAGLTGKDWILENSSDVVLVSDLVYSKVSNRPARWVLAVRGDSPYKRPEDLAGKKIATGTQNFTESYFRNANIPVEVSFSWGATEAKVVEGLADAIVEVTETGTTIKAHGIAHHRRIAADQHPAHRQ